MLSGARGARPCRLRRPGARQLRFLPSERGQRPTRRRSSATSASSRSACRATARSRANADPRYVDLGLCGPLRDDLRERADYCGAFRTPTLRNVATRQSFFHNGVVHDLAEVVRFYATRDSDPAHWYGRDAQGRPRRYDDLPAAYRGNVHRDAPFGRRVGAPRALSEGDVHWDIVAFLRTLTDADAVQTMPPELPTNRRSR